MVDPADLLAVVPKDAVVHERVFVVVPLAEDALVQGSAVEADLEADEEAGGGMDAFTGTQSADRLDEVGACAHGLELGVADGGGVEDRGLLRSFGPGDVDPRQLGHVDSGESGHVRNLDLDVGQFHARPDREEDRNTSHEGGNCGDG